MWYTYTMEYYSAFKNYEMNLYQHGKIYVISDKSWLT